MRMPPHTHGHAHARMVRRRGARAPRREGGAARRLASAMDIFSTGPPLTDGLAQWGTEVSSSSSYGAGLPIVGEIQPSSLATPHAAVASAEPQPSASPRGKGPVQTGELELLPRSQIQKLVAAQLGMNPNLKLSVSQEAVDALQKVRCPRLLPFFASRLPC